MSERIIENVIDINVNTDNLAMEIAIYKGLEGWKIKQREYFEAVLNVIEKYYKETDFYEERFNNTNS